MDRGRRGGGRALMGAVEIAALVMIAEGTGTAAITVNASGGADYMRIEIYID